MSSAAIFTSILAALLVGAVSPGASFVLVSRISVSRSRANGISAALGMGVGGAVLGCLAVLGLLGTRLIAEGAAPCGREGDSFLVRSITG